MKVFIATCAATEWSEVATSDYRLLAEKDRIRVHEIVGNPELADIILFVDIHMHGDDWRLKGLHHHPLTKKYPHKIFVYDERDKPWCSWPGVYVGATLSNYDQNRQRSYSYVYLRNDSMRPSLVEPDLLFSFQGARSHPVRNQILQIAHPRAHIEDPDVNFFDFSEDSKTTEYQEKVARQKALYTETVARSKFVLCPRGQGPSSFRLYETMAAGRVPVIISDEWVAPHGPDWEKCSIRVPESEVATVGSILEKREADFASMSAQAYASYKEWFAPEVIFHRLIESCADIQKSGKVGCKPFYFLDYAFFRKGGQHYKGKVKSWIDKRSSKAK